MLKEVGKMWQLQINKIFSETGHLQVDEVVKHAGPDAEPPGKKRGGDVSVE